MNWFNRADNESLSCQPKRILTRCEGCWFVEVPGIGLEYEVSEKELDKILEVK